MIAASHRPPRREAPADKAERKKAKQEREDEALDRALSDTFPASDPVSLTEPAPPEPKPPKH